MYGIRTCNYRSVCTNRKGAFLNDTFKVGVTVKLSACNELSRSKYKFDPLTRMLTFVSSVCNVESVYRARSRSLHSAAEPLATVYAENLKLVVTAGSS